MTDQISLSLHKPSTSDPCYSIVICRAEVGYSGDEPGKHLCFKQNGAVLTKIDEELVGRVELLATKINVLKTVFRSEYLSLVYLWIDHDDGLSLSVSFQPASYWKDEE